MATKFAERNLIEIYGEDEQVLAGIESLNLKSEHPKFKKGQVIQFIGGYNSDILFTSRITGFDSDGDIYVLWDCYWFPIRDEKERQIKIID